MGPNYRVIAFDPGGTTGWATYTALWSPGLPIPYSYEAWHCGQLGPDKHHAELKQLLGLQRLENYTVVCERFTDRKTGHNVDLMAREYIGVIETYCQEEGVKLAMQMSGAAKPFVKNANLKSLGLLEGPKWKHAMDARRHLLWYLINGTPHRHDLLQKGWPNE